MRKRSFRVQDTEGNSIFVYEWLPAENRPVQAIVQIAHGMAETAARYERLARILTQEGCAVYANDHLGHGQTAGTPERLGMLGRNSFRQMAEHVGMVTECIREAYGDSVPLFLLGHSMGSFLIQRLMATYRTDPHRRGTGVILSGSNGRQGPMLGMGIAIAAWECRVKGEQHRSALLNRLVFGSYNKAFRPNRTPFDWLSRDGREVDAYMKDSECGALFNSGFYLDFFRGLKEIHDPNQLSRIPQDLPVYLFSGDQDPVGEFGKGVLRLADLYKKLGLRDVSVKLYPGGRHEMLNELNRDEVTHDLLGWLSRQIAATYKG